MQYSSILSIISTPGYSLSYGNPSAYLFDNEDESTCLTFLDK